jgi:hypothetical protein
VEKHPTQKVVTASSDLQILPRPLRWNVLWHQQQTIAEWEKKSNPSLTARIIIKWCKIFFGHQANWDSMYVLPFTESYNMSDGADFFLLVLLNIISTVEVGARIRVI